MGSPLASGPALAERGVREGDLPFDPCPPRGVPAELGMLVQQVDEGLDEMVRQRSAKNEAACQLIRTSGLDTIMIGVTVAARSSHS